MNQDEITLLFCSAAGLLVLTLWHRKHDDFDARHLIVDSKTNRVSLRKCGQFFALLVSTWVLIHETRVGRLTEWLFIGYMASWAGANLAAKWIERDKKEQ